MGTVTSKVLELFEEGQESDEALARAVFCSIAEGIDELLVQRAQNIQQSNQNPGLESFESKKSKALMVTIERIMGEYQNINVEMENDAQGEAIWELFETAKEIFRSKDGEELFWAIKKLSKEGA